MTSRERITAAFEHRDPDRTPIWEKLIKSPAADDLLGRPCAASNFHYRMERLADGDWDGLVEQWARDEVELCELLGFDMIRLYEIGGPPAERPVRVDEETWRTGRTYQQRMASGWIRTWTEGAPAPDLAAREAAMRQSLSGSAPPVGGVTDPDRSRSVTAPTDPTAFRLIRTARRLMAEKGMDLPIFCAVYSVGVATLPEFMLEWFITDRDLLAEYYRRNAVAGLHRARQLVAEGADVIALGGDFACDHGPMCSPPDYRAFIAANLREQSRPLHDLGVWTTNASDGDLWPVLHDFLVTAEVDGYEEIDFAAGMDLARLKREFPLKTFIGNIDIRHTLTSGTPEQVRAHTRECIEKGWGGGGHILMSGNCIHENVQTDLFLTHLNTYREVFGLPSL
ncbi:hypothetical protein LLH23_00315 [bacterium]|nr:hypothetical protein [bacterium]